jgi:eukaryotic-like serine/threonine-protein kinase
LGSYRLLEEIGSGGVGVVYRAAHVETGELVALKTVRSRRESFLASVRREIHTLKQLRHPGVVRILDGGVEDGMPWYAMELIEGQTLQSRVRITRETGGASDATWVGIDGVPGATAEAAEQIRELRTSAGSRFGTGLLSPLPELGGMLTVIRRICTPLAFLHGEGVVHRDLKPSNIFVRPNGTPVVMDFGMAWRWLEGGRDVLETSSFGGTLAYMAPEQISGDAVDARADLYALGCILYETICGRLPFTANSEPELLQQHLIEDPQPLSELIENIPPELDELVLRLLRKRPRDRLGHASDVEVVLARLGASGWPAAEPAPPARAYLYRPSLCGREAIVGEVAEALQMAAGGQGGLRVLVGESGIGKTSVALEATRLARARRMRVVAGGCSALGVAQKHAPEKGSPLQAFSQLFQAVIDRCVARGEQESERLLGPHAKVLAECEPGLLRVPGADSFPDPPELPAQAAQRRLLDALADTLTALAEQRPLLLVLDDLQWADELSLRFLEDLPADYLKSKGVLILATCRAEEMPPAVTRIGRRADAGLLTLGALDEPAVAGIVADMLGLASVPPSLTRALAPEPEGNPFFVAEYLRTALSENILERDPQGHWTVSRPLDGLKPPSLPGSVRDLLERRLRALSAGATRVMELGAVFGREIPTDLLAGVGDGLDESVLAAAITELMARHVLEDGPLGQLRFTHDKLRVAAYERIQPELRRQYHRQVARAIEDGHGGTDSFPLYFARLAHHHREAGDVERAVHFFELAGDLAHRNFANHEAVSFFEEAIALSQGQGLTIEPLRRARWERFLASAKSGLGLVADSRTHLMRAVEYLGWPMPRRRLALFAALGGEVLRQAWHQLAPHQLAPRRAARAGDAALERYREGARAYDLLMPISYYVTGDLAEILYATVRNLNVAEKAGPSPELALAYANANATTALIPAFALARRYGRLARQAVDGLDNRLVESWVYVMNGVYRTGLGEWDEALRYADLVIRLAEQLGFPRRLEEGWALYATTNLLRGDVAAAGRGYATIRASAVRGDPQTLNWALGGLAHVAALEGDAARAVELAEEAEKLLVRDLGRPEHIYTYATLALARQMRGDTGGATEAVDRAAAWIAKGAPVAFYNAHSYWSVVEVSFQLWSQAPADRRAEARLIESLRQVRACARTFPVVRPRALYWAARYALAKGRQARAQRLMKKAEALARHYGVALYEFIMK